ncbi:MAG: globin-coupled sensor protein [Rhodospirillaceae bacterium]|nr:globin-coupled sensor protein [Rhodospirillaceae bacterium]
MSDDFDRGVRLGFLNIDERTREALREFRPLLVRHIDQVLEDFYIHVKHSPAAAVFHDQASMDRARRQQKQHWLDNVFSGSFNDAYFAEVTKIGRAHVHVGLEPRWYIAGYCYVVNILVGIAIQNYRKKPERLQEIIQAINKAAFLDMDLAISVYHDLSQREETAKAMQRHIDAFERDVRSVLTVVSSAVTDLYSTAQNMATTADGTMSFSSTVSHAAEQASENVQTVAAATEELSSSIQEIGRQITESARVASSAVEEADKVNNLVMGLADAAGKIGDVVKLINDIASQTNLLALNATIEAARAGDAGKGFAVVAGEVKNLANQTAKATDEISAQIAAVQNATKDAVSAIRDIGATITKISGITAAIATSIEEQGAATQEIARNIQEAARATGDVTDTISHVTTAAGETKDAARDVLGAAEKLSKQSEGLSTNVEAFLENVRGNV